MTKRKDSLNLFRLLVCVESTYAHTIQSKWHLQIMRLHQVLFKLLRQQTHIPFPFHFLSLFSFVVSEIFQQMMTTTTPSTPTKRVCNSMVYKRIFFQYDFEINYQLILIVLTFFCKFCARAVYRIFFFLFFFTLWSSVSQNKQKHFQIKHK